VRRRLLASYLVLTLVVLVALEVPLDISYGDRAHQQVSIELQRDAFAVASLSEETLEGDAHADLQRIATSYQRHIGGRVIVTDGHGRVVADSQQPAEVHTSLTGQPEIRAALAGHITSGSLPAGALDTDVFFIAMPVNPEGHVLGTVRISYPAEGVDHRIHRYWLELALLGAICLAAAALLGIVFARWVSRPLSSVAEAARRLGAGDLAARSDERAGPPEVRDLSTAFDAMADRLEQLVSAHQAFVADASHQLRTPLTALRLRLENLASEVEGTEAIEDLDGARAETARLSRLVDGLLILARADRAREADARETVDVDDLTSERLDVWRPIAEEYGLTLAGPPSGLRVRARRDHLAQVIDNLLANAADASPPGREVRVTARRSRDGRWVEIHVVDQGPGLDPQQRRDAFGRFWRGDPRRTDPLAPSEDGTQLGGSGLGLAIVRQLVQADDGQVELLDAPGGGLDAVLRLRPAR
jgi:signal transduction histidine kinase